MNKISTWSLSAVLIFSLAMCGCRDKDRNNLRDLINNTQTVEIEITDYKPPRPKLAELVDDKLDDKKTTFDPELVHSEPLEGWLVNLSDAVTKLDIPLIKPDRDKQFLVLHASYKQAIEKNKSSSGAEILPSVNMLDGKAKQFDDGLYAALDQAYYEGLDDTFLSHVELVKQVLDKVGPRSVAAPYLAAGLELAGHSVDVEDTGRKNELLATFRASATHAKPIGFYTWNESLRQCFQFLRYFQRPFEASELDVPIAIAHALSDDSLLLDAYRKANDFYAHLTNPLKHLTVADLLGLAAPDGAALEALRADRGADAALVAFFPASSSREDRLFARLFARRPLPPDMNLMRELIARIRSGEIDLAPAENAGWYDYQVYALETMLLPERGEENNKLLLTQSYKKRMLEAFKALVTKRKETHVRQLGAPGVDAAAAPPRELEQVKPRLRVEPCPSYFVRTARAYAFLYEMLDATIGQQALKSLHGLRQDGRREDDLHTELAFMRDLFYGLYLISAEDIGLRPTIADDEPVDQDRCYQTARDWLATAVDDPDLAADTRVSIPVMRSIVRGKTRLWITLGVRMNRLKTSYARPPRVKPRDVEGQWKEVDAWKLAPTDYLIAVDEFAEVELDGNVALTREELRQICDGKTKEEIIAALLALKADRSAQQRPQAPARPPALVSQRSS